MKEDKSDYITSFNILISFIWTLTGKCLILIKEARYIMKNHPENDALSLASAI